MKRILTSGERPETQYTKASALEALRVGEGALIAIKASPLWSGNGYWWKYSHSQRILSSLRSETVLWALLNCGMPGWHPGSGLHIFRLRAHVENSAVGE